MKLKPFTRVGTPPDTVYINPERVESLEVGATAEMTVINLASGKAVVVQGTPAAVAAALQAP